ncbi:MAG TPA: STAS domain-containing protein [Vicinamibacteria bacterium]
MPLSFEQTAGVDVVRVLDAKLTYPTLSPFFTSVLELVERGARKVVIDLEAVSFIDSAAIGCLVDVHRLLKDKEGAVKLAGMQTRVETMLTMAGLGRIFELHRRTAEAIAAFGGWPEPKDASSGGGTGAGPSRPGTKG